MKYICSNCGSDRTDPYDGRPSLDDRFAVGICHACSGETVNNKPVDRALVREDHWDPAILERRKARRQEQLALKHAYLPEKARVNPRTGQLSIRKPTVDETEAARAIIARNFGEIEKKESSNHE